MHSRLRVTVLTLPISGHVGPLVPVLSELVARGCDVTVTSTPDLTDKLAATGATLSDYPAEIVARVATPPEGLARICHELAEATYQSLPWSLDLLRHTEPDVVLVDASAPWGRLAAERLGVPCVSSSTTFVVHAGLESTWQLRAQLVAEVVGGLPHLVRYAATRRRLRRQYGVDLGGPLRVLGGMADRTIAWTSRGLQPGSDHLGDDVVFVGSPVSVASPDHPELADLPAGPLVYVSLGTRLNHRPDFLRACLTAFADHPGPVLLSIGDRTDVSELGELPANAIVRRFVPQLAVLARASLFVTHAGMNSASESLVHGVPMLLYPQTADQPLVASRLERLGAGRVLTGSPPSPESIRRAADELLASDASSRARALGADLLDCGGSGRAADVVLSMVKA